MNLHWHILVTQSRQFILRLHLGVVWSKNFVKCVLPDCRITQSICSAYLSFLHHCNKKKKSDGVTVLSLPFAKCHAVVLIACVFLRLVISLSNRHWWFFMPFHGWCHFLVSIYHSSLVLSPTEDILIPFKFWQWERKLL